MFEAHQTAILDFLQARALVDSDQLEALTTDTTGRSTCELALAQGWLSRDRLLSELAEHLSYDYVAELPEQLAGEAVAALPGNLARTYGVAPLRTDLTRMQLAAVDPLNPRIVEDLTFALGKDIAVVVADPDKVSQLIHRHYGEDEMALEVLWTELESRGEEVAAEDLTEAELAAMAEDAPIIRLVNLVLAQAVRDQASDIHFEPFEREYKIRYRVDGALLEMAPPPKHLALPIASRLKVLANLNIAERRVPQDGRIKITLRGRPVDLRVSTLPTQFGESVVLRVLDQGAVQLDLGQLSMPTAVESGIRSVIDRPNGILVVTGPTGSGKTTTLYSALRELNHTERKILTAEDPVEFEIDGIMQVPINAGIGLTFGRTLRTFLRQDPDIIMVGEIRDLETAQIAIQASLTGHLVLATLHTNDAAGAVTRLVDMGVEPFLISSSLEGILAQRLVRKICSACRESYEPPAAVRRQLGLAANEPLSCSRGGGCEACGGSGYRGRHGLFEWLPVSESLRAKINQNQGTFDLREQARVEGITTLRQAGIDAIRQGLTTVEEVLQYT
jgi:type IV pilus assembly protein PilB